MVEGSFQFYQRLGTGLGRSDLFTVNDLPTGRNLEFDLFTVIVDKGLHPELSKPPL
jgi:hypothetical protein